MGVGLDGGLLTATCGPAYRTLPAHTALPQAALTLTVLASCVPSFCAPFSSSWQRFRRSFSSSRLQWVQRGQARVELGSC